jgi:hypothetical protein
VSTAIEPVQGSDWQASFRASAWFTRGWTLQELIAPVSVEFFSCEGHGLGDEASLDELLHDITSIPLRHYRTVLWTTSAHLNESDGLIVA